MKYRFGVFELDEAAGELRRGGKPVSVQPKPFALLAYLVRERDRVVPADELFEALWPDTVVSPGSLTRAVSHARRAIGDTGRGTLLRSVARRGYRFTGDVAVVDADSAGAPVAAGRRAPPRRAAAAPAGGAREHFVGRRDALERLGEAARLLEVGRGGLVLVTGPPGIGKTRLTEVFSRQMADQGFLPVVGRCVDRDGVPAFWLWVQVLRRLVEEDDLRAELAALPATSAVRELVPALRDITPERVLPDDLGPEEQRFLFFDAAARTLLACARKRPIVLLLEDLQWAGSPSLRLLEHLAGELGESRLLVVATVRDEPRERGHPVDRATAMLRQQSTCSHLALGGLSRGEVGELLAHVLGRPAPVDLTSELFARSEGVPFFLAEAIRVLAERGDLARPERIPRHGITLPAQSVDLIRRALDGLTPDCADLLGAGTVLGRDFTLTQLAGLAETPRGEALDHIDEAIRAGILEESEDGVASYRFSHALFQEAIYEGLPVSVRTRLHHKAAARLESQHADGLEHVLAELAHHHHHGIAVGDPERAHHFATRAAEEAARVHAYEQAALHYEQAAAALEHFESVDPSRRLETLLALGEAHRLGGDRKRRHEVFEQALQSARSLARPGDFARAAIGLCEVSEWAQADERAKAWLEEALTGLGRDELESRARLVTRLGYLAVRRVDEALPLGREGVRLARESGDPETLQEALYVLHYILSGPDHLDERAEMLLELTHAAGRSGNRDVAVIAVLDVACDAVMVGEVSEARRLREEANAIGGRHPSPSSIWHMRIFDTGWALLQGRLAEVEQRAHDALLAGRRIDHPYARSCFNGHMALLDRELGRPNAIVERVRPGLHHPLGASHWSQALVGRALVEDGEEVEARMLFEDLAKRDFGDVDRTIRWTGTIGEIAMLCAELEDTARAGRLLDLLATAPRQHGLLPMTLNYGGPLSRAMARLSITLGLADDALGHFEDALATAERVGALPTLARIALDAGPVYARSGDTARAKELLASSLGIAERLGMTGVALRARQAIERL